MRKKKTLYIDESGKSSLKEVENNPFIMTGVIIDDSEISSIEGFFNYIKRKYGVPTTSPFHSYHIYEAPSDKLSDSKLLELSKTLADFVSLIPAEVKIIEVNKEDFRTALGVTSLEDFKGSALRKQMPDFPYQVMSTVLFDWFAKHLHADDAIGQILCDSRRGADQHMLRTLNSCKQGNVPFTSADSVEYINKRITAICFSEKNYLSGGLEITDLISFISYFRVRRLITANKHIGADLLWDKIAERTKIEKIDGEAVRRFFGIKNGEVHKYLK